MADEKNLAKSAPWVTYTRELKKLFAEDPSINIITDPDNEYQVNIYVENIEKAYVIEHLLPNIVTFGNIELKINVIPGNLDINSKTKLFNIVFADNSVLEDSIQIDPYGTGSPITFLVFRKEVVQFFDDDLTDPNGNVSTLWQDIASDVFLDTDEVRFCTSTEDRK